MSRRPKASACHHPMTLTSRRRAWACRHHLMIPMNAEGADALFDAFTAVPGLTPARLVEAARSAPQRYTTIWAKPQGRLH